MLRVYARVLAAALVAAVAVRVPGWGPVAALFYLGSAAAFAYAGFRREDAAVVRGIVAEVGSLFLLSGLLLALAMGIIGFPFGGRGWEVGLAHAAFGGLTMACAALLPCDDDGPASR